MNKTLPRSSLSSSPNKSIAGSDSDLTSDLEEASIVLSSFCKRKENYKTRIMTNLKVWLSLNFSLPDFLDHIFLWN